YMDPHQPYLPSQEHLRGITSKEIDPLKMLYPQFRAGAGWGVSDDTLEDLRLLYDATVRQADASIGRLVDFLRREGIRDEICLIIAGDHGEEFQEHGHLAHYPKLYNELINVPLIIDHPKGEYQEVSEAVGLGSIPPTVCDVMDVKVEKRGIFEESSLRNVVLNGESPRDKPAMSVAVRKGNPTDKPIPLSLNDGELLVSARTEDWTYIHHTESGERELYDRNSDRGEHHNLLKNGTHDVPDQLHHRVEKHVRKIKGGK
ncbi:MAG: sulfatase-like hydrolase/transferase, partial [Halobacteria archaeon]|nr:sulfatase-like hydrolase/transferase [Halobacteria archaeon]